MIPKRPLASSDDDGHCLAPPHRDGDVLHPNRDRIASDDALVQHLDSGTLDEAKFHQPAFQFTVRQRRACLAGSQMPDDTREAASSQSERQLRSQIVLFGHVPLFSTAARQVKRCGLNAGAP